MSIKRPPNVCVAIALANEIGTDIPDEKLSEFAKGNGYRPSILIKNYKEYCRLLKTFQSL